MQYSTHLLRHLRHTIGRDIHAARLKQKMPLKKLAHLTNIPEHKLDHYELGKGEIGLEEWLRVVCVLEIKNTGTILQ